MAFINVGKENATVTCDAQCFDAMGFTAGEKLSAKDLWAGTTTSITASSFSDTVQADGGSKMFRLSKA